MKRNKIYERRESTKDFKLYFIFCEGDKRETMYFYFFNRITSQIIIQIVPIEDGRNSPMGLYNNACQGLLKSEKNPNPSYTINEDNSLLITANDLLANATAFFSKAVLTT